MPLLRRSRIDRTIQRYKARLFEKRRKEFCESARAVDGCARQYPKVFWVVFQKKTAFSPARSQQ
jgi:hypothetical protein